MGRDWLYERTKKKKVHKESQTKPALHLGVEERQSRQGEHIRSHHEIPRGVGSQERITGLKHSLHVASSRDLPSRTLSPPPLLSS